MAVNNDAVASAGGMPQLDFSTFPNQVFWLIVSMICLFLMVRLLIIPRMDNILGNRRKVIEEDLVGAEKLRETAQELKNSITEEVDLARLRAAEIIGKSKEKIKETRNKGLAEAAEITSALLEESEKVIQKMQKDADKQIRRLSEDLAPEIVTKLSTQD